MGQAAAQARLGPIRLHAQCQLEWAKGVTAGPISSSVRPCRAQLLVSGALPVSLRVGTVGGDGWYEKPWVPERLGIRWGPSSNAPKGAVLRYIQECVAHKPVAMRPQLSRVGGRWRSSQGWQAASSDAGAGSACCCHGQAATGSSFSGSARGCRGSRAGERRLVWGRVPAAVLPAATRSAARRRAGAPLQLFFTLRHIWDAPDEGYYQQGSKLWLLLRGSRGLHEQHGGHVSFSASLCSCQHAQLAAQACVSIGGVHTPGLSRHLLTPTPLWGAGPRLLLLRLKACLQQESGGYSFRFSEDELFGAVPILKKLWASFEDDMEAHRRYSAWQQGAIRAAGSSSAGAAGCPIVSETAKGSSQALVPATWRFCLPVGHANRVRFSFPAAQDGESEASSVCSHSAEFSSHMAAAASESVSSAGGKPPDLPACAGQVPHSVLAQAGTASAVHTRPLNLFSITQRNAHNQQDSQSTVGAAALRADHQDSRWQGAHYPQHHV